MYIGLRDAAESCIPLSSGLVKRGPSRFRCYN
jgi:hypothetical protein